jgi:3-hydroxybutyryl-CoA dehydrogenase
VRAHVESAWGRAIDKGKLTTESAEKARHLLKVATRLKDAAAVDFAIEAVPEAIDLKQMVFAELDDLCPPRTILASNTSSLSITRIARSTGRRDRVIGIHFFNPVAAMPLVELVAGKETSAETESRSLALVESLGKQAVRVTDTPGFATSRLGVALGLEAMRMLEEGVANAADIDRAMELGYGHRMGPLKTSDLVGLDVRLAIAETLAAELPSERFHPPKILQTLVAEGKTGKKASEGFFRWDGDKATGPGERATKLAELARRR